MSSVFENNPEEEKPKKTDHVTVSWKSYVNYIFYSSWNKLLFPLTLLLFVGTEINTTLYYRFITEYDSVLIGESETFASIEGFWVTLGLMVLGGVIVSIVRYSFIGYIIASSNILIYNDMVGSIMNTPLSYFDTNPQGNILNKFSNDMNTLDVNMLMLFTGVIEGPIVTLVMLANMVEINIWFIIPAVVCVAFFIFMFAMCRRIIVASKQLDSKEKSPAYANVTEMASGLNIRSRHYGDRHDHRACNTHEREFCFVQSFRGLFLANGLFLSNFFEKFSKH